MKKGHLDSTFEIRVGGKLVCYIDFGSAEGLESFMESLSTKRASVNWEELYKTAKNEQSIIKNFDIAE